MNNGEAFRAIDGILCLDKPPGATSFHCVAVIRRLLSEAAGRKIKVGHAGTLDPMATGVLPLLAGKATRALDLLPSHDKRYTATLRFGMTSDTLDVWGDVRKTGAPAPTLAAVESALPAFRGEILQVPPMVSALKKDGVRLYELARRGETIEREARPVTVYALGSLAYDAAAGELTLDCHCSKGTYIRTICDDLGRVLGCGAVLTGLRRTMAAGFGLADCVTLGEAEALAAQGALADRLIAVDRIFSGCAALTVSPAQAARFSNGGVLALERLTAAPDGRTRVYAPDGRFLGLGEPDGDELKILKLF